MSRHNRPPECGKVLRRDARGIIWIAKGSGSKCLCEGYRYRMVGGRPNLEWMRGRMSPDTAIRRFGKWISEPAVLPVNDALARLDALDAPHGRTDVDAPHGEQKQKAQPEPKGEDGPMSNKNQQPETAAPDRVSILVYRDDDGTVNFANAYIDDDAALAAVEQSNAALEIAGKSGQFDLESVKVKG